mgnify:CR=1 FL=1
MAGACEASPAARTGPHKDAPIVWPGRIEGDTLAGTVTSVIRRWYWTPERDFGFGARPRRDLTRDTGRP